MEDKNIQITQQQLLEILQKRIDEAEQQMARMCGMQLYKNPNGFTQGELYSLCGKDDAVVNVSFNPETESAKEYGNEITVSLSYTRDERKSLERDIESLNNVEFVKAKELMIDYDKDKGSQLLSNGFRPKDVTAILVAPTLHSENTFTSKEQRNIHKLEIPFEGEGGGRDIGWMYGGLKRFIAYGIALTPDEHAEYLAYKLILEKEELTDEEKSEIFNDEGAIENNEVSWCLLNWKKEANKLSETDKKNLAILFRERLFQRLGKLDDVLQGIGGISKYVEKYPEQAKLIVDKVLHFRQRRYNIQGKHLLYLDLNGFIHIYLRHVEELTINGLFAERTKFQLKEDDVLFVISHVMESLNDEYQKFKETHPDWKFRKYKDDAYYFNGDYYRIEVDEHGRLITFFKEDDKNKKR